MKRRPRRVIPAVVVALVLVAACVVVAVSVVQKLSGTRELVSYDDVAGRLHDTTWGSGWVLGGGIAVMVIGVLLLAVALMPGRPVVLPLESEDGVHAGITRRSLRAAVRDAADSVPGLESARVRLGSKKIRVKGRTHEAAAEAAGSVRAAIDERLDLVAPRVRHTVTTRVRPTDAGGTR
ncbi:DUF6286 domain-containing protein [Nocardia sp. BMG51109]|uniref:DUF6286 domain-containing protein n=1 Tax=Nocardia sp. BMG51109 TaxID=1056816 RepID=UPI0004650117|nr:DUF6286 domain-containing protein [Nocardia sp. BMG51109]